MKRWSATAPIIAIADLSRWSNVNSNADLNHLFA